jgi:hypothetical protein
MPNQEIVYLPIEELKLWTENPRDPLENNPNDFEIISLALENKNDKWKLHTLAMQMGSYYDFSELPIVVNVNGHHVVYDGNRRIAILKYLKNEYAFEGYPKLKFTGSSEEMRSLKKIPCNICDQETALNSVERKHTQNGTWKPLERDWFRHLHRKEEKSSFIKFDEATGLISVNPKMNQGFVKDEILRKENLNKIGFDYNKSRGYSTNYNQDNLNSILKGVTDLVNNGIISTRKYRGKILEPLIDHYPDLKNKIKPYDPKLQSYVLQPIEEIGKDTIPIQTRKTKVTKEKKIIFGKILSLEQGRVNDLYSAIKMIYEKDSDNKQIISIIGMSLRLLLETAARVYYKNLPIVADDKIYSKFLKDTSKSMNDPVKKPAVNFLALTSTWLSGKMNMDAILGKFAHGNITPSEQDVLQQSEIIGDILEFHFKKKR